MLTIPLLVQQFKQAASLIQNAQTMRLALMASARTPASSHMLLVPPMQFVPPKCIVLFASALQDGLVTPTNNASNVSSSMI